MATEMEGAEKGICCPKCGFGITLEEVLNKENRQFLQSKYVDGKLDDIVTIARIVTDQLPQLVLSSETKAFVESLASSFENKMDTSINTLTVLSNMLQKLPDGIRAELEKIGDKTTKSSESVLQTFNELINKPSSKGRVAEKTLSQAWQMTYTNDLVDEKGGPGKTDFVVTASIKEKQTLKMTVERKTGSQKYNLKHIKEAIGHARDEGAKYAMVVYDSSDDNLPDTFGPMYIDRMEGITVAVADITNNGWKMARYVFTVLELSAIGEDREEQIDFKKISDTIKEMGKIAEQINSLRKRNNSAVQACEGVRDVINSLEQTFDQNIAKLQAELVVGG